MVIFQRWMLHTCLLIMLVFSVLGVHKSVAATTFDIPRFLENQSSDDARRQIEDRTEDVMEIGTYIIIATAVLVVFIAIGLYVGGKRGDAVKMITTVLVGLVMFSLLGVIVKLGLQGL